jgi:hypothetical protein
VASEKPLMADLILVVRSKQSPSHRNANATFQVFAHQPAPRFLATLFISTGVPEKGPKGVNPQPAVRAIIPSRFRCHRDARSWSSRAIAARRRRCRLIPRRGRLPFSELKRKCAVPHFHACMSKHWRFPAGQSANHLNSQLRSCLQTPLLSAHE